MKTIIAMMVTHNDNISSPIHAAAVPDGCTLKEHTLYVVKGQWNRLKVEPTIIYGLHGSVLGNIQHYLLCPGYGG